MNEYQGEDLILAAGAPGSGWSGVINNICYGDEINRTDVGNADVYCQPGYRGRHVGTYFGPYENYGKQFDRLDQYSNDELLAEFKKPFRNFEGIKIIKSHQFCYSLDLLYEYFPKARYLCVFRETDELTFDWWHKCGGWEISHPKYTWYENDERMLKQIAIENRAIHKFIDEKRLKVFNCVFDLMEVYDFLNLTLTESSTGNAPFAGSERFNNLPAKERFYKLRYGTRLNNNPYLYAAIL